MRSFCGSKIHTLGVDNSGAQSPEAMGKGLHNSHLSVKLFPGVYGGGSLLQVCSTIQNDSHLGCEVSPRFDYFCNGGISSYLLVQVAGRWGV